MKTNLKLILTVLACSVLFAACGNETNQSPQQETPGEHAGEEQAEGTVSLTSMQRETIGLELGKLQNRNLTGTIKVTGELELPPQYEADISAIVGGTVSEIKVIEGDKVQKGQMLALLEHPDFVQMQVELQQSSSRLDYLKQEYERQQNLYEQGVGSGKTSQAAKAEYFSTKAKVKGLKAKLNMLNLNVENILDGEIYQTIPVVSPIDGFIKSVNVRIGEYVAPGDLLLEVVDNSHIHADLMVFEKDVYKVEEGQKVYFTVSNAPNRQYTATIYAVGKTFEEDPKAVHVHAEIEGDTEKLIPGTYIEGRIAVNSESVTALPEAAIVGEGDESYIFIKTGETSHEEEAGATEKSWVFKQVPVSTGVQDNGWVEVSFFEPLADSVQIAYNGAYKLISEMNKSETSHGH
ncbi:MAG TPA: efflux RND transporter periplasmic adaptor subunit [Gracilimonas sp.]|uniref:efflux RND transporter periplasmic adaptor subunit n=1 Tax=Gracilimonas sp. TaxID=1974203 RepID=UPI002DA20B62|nr:efflux RND transporter periplasmic adaptor subunit [Gracilimonas sp.]